MHNAISDSPITHEGVVTSVSGACVEVRVIRSAACADCAAVSLCRAVGSHEAVIRTTCDDGSTLSVGDSVVVESTVGQGLRAVLFAYVAPLVLMVVVLALSLTFLRSEPMAALLALVAVGVYYACLHLVGGTANSHLSFVVRRTDGRSNKDLHIQ